MRAHDRESAAILRDRKACIVATYRTPRLRRNGDDLLEAFLLPGCPLLRTSFTSSGMRAHVALPFPRDRRRFVDPMLPFVDATERLVNFCPSYTPRRAGARALGAGRIAVAHTGA
jgi:hypothetical protein